MPDLTRVYGWLLNLYPARFREEYLEPMRRQFLDEYRDASTGPERLRLWARAMWDLLTSLPAEMAKELSCDLKHAPRVYKGRAVSAVLAVVALALAIGVSTGVFSVLNALLVRGLPFSSPEQLVELLSSPFSAGVGRAPFHEWRERNPYFQNAAALSITEMNLARDRDALRVKVAETSANFFELLGTGPIVGRTFAPDEDIYGKSSVAVISHSLWLQIFGGDPGVTGVKIRLSGTLLTVIGVAPPRFDYPGQTGIWTPTIFDFERVPKHGAIFFRTIGRLKPGLDFAGARDLFEAEVRMVAPKSLNADEQNRARMISLRNQLAGPVRQASWVLAGMVLLVLLAACANVAQLLLSRTTERRHELAIRAALGASRGRLVQQLIVEAMAVTTASAVLGLLIAQWTARLAAAVAPAQLASQTYTVFDWRVVGFAVGLAAVTGIVFGVIPAFTVGWLRTSESIVRVHAGAMEPQTKRMRASLVTLQAALTVTLVTCSVAMGRTFLKLLDADLGLRPANVVTLNVSLQGTKYRNGASQWQYYSEVLNRLRTLSGVEAAGAVGYLPLANNAYMATGVRVDSSQTMHHVITNGAMPGYFRAIGTNVVAGREFEPGERQRSERAVIVNEALARESGLGTAIVGRRLITHWSKTPYVIVGLVETIRLAGPSHPGGPQVYWPVEEEPTPNLTFVAKVNGRAEEFLARCAAVVRAVDREVPVYDVKTLDQRLADILSRPQFYTTATLFLAVFALLLAAAGTYGVTAYSVARRKHEMGLRIALGASHSRVRSMVVRESLLPIAIGVAMGIYGAIGAGHYLQFLLSNAQAVDWSTCASGAAFLLLAGFIAALSATTRVLTIDPADALRAQ